jgi:hypothetical protein
MNDVFSAGDVKEKSIANIYAASFIYARGVQLVTVIVDRARSSIFVFNNADNGADRALQEYYAGGLISGRELHKALGVLKTEADTVRGRPGKARA